MLIDKTEGYIMIQSQEALNRICSIRNNEDYQKAKKVMNEIFDSFDSSESIFKRLNNFAKTNPDEFNSIVNVIACNLEHDKYTPPIHGLMSNERLKEYTTPKQADNKLGSKEFHQQVVHTFKLGSSSEVVTYEQALEECKYHDFDGILRKVFRYVRYLEENQKEIL